MKKRGFLVGLTLALCALVLPAKSFASPLDGFHHQVASAADPVLSVETIEAVDVAAVNHGRPSGITGMAGPPGATVDPDDAGGLAVATNKANRNMVAHRHLKPEVGWRC